MAAENLLPCSWSIIAEIHLSFGSAKYTINNSCRAPVIVLIAVWSTFAFQTLNCFKLIFINLFKMKLLLLVQGFNIMCTIILYLILVPMATTVLKEQVVCTQYTTMTFPGVTYWRFCHFKPMRGFLNSNY